MTMTGYFAEHSNPESYLAGNLALLANPALLPHPPGPLVGVDPAAHVDASARIVPPVRLAAGAVVEAGAVVGPWAVVCGGGRVSAGSQVVRSVVWSGATAQGNLAGTILAPEGPFLAETTPRRRRCEEAGIFSPQRAQRSQSRTGKGRVGFFPVRTPSSFPTSVFSVLSVVEKVTKSD